MKIAPSEPSSTRRLRRNEPVILFSIAGQMFAINAGAIHEICSTDSIAAAASEITPQSLAKVRHLLRRGRSTFFVVSGCAHFGLERSRAQHVLVLRNPRIALLVDSIDRMGTISRLMPLPAGFSGPERSWYRGITLISGNVVPVVNPSGFLNDQELAQLDSVAAQTSMKAQPNVRSRELPPRSRRNDTCD